MSCNVDLKIIESNDINILIPLYIEGFLFYTEAQILTQKIQNMISHYIFSGFSYPWMFG